MNGADLGVKVRLQRRLNGGDVGDKGFLGERGWRRKRGQILFQC